MKRLVRAIAAIVIVAPLAPLAARAQGAANPALTVERIFASGDFAPDFFGPTRWLDDSTYTSVENGALVRVDAASGRTTALVTTAQLTPPGAKQPLELEDYAWSSDHAKLLVFTNSARVWRANTRGDFWVLDLATKKLQKLGGPAAKPSTLQFAKFSPDGKRVAYVREHNVYVESLADSRITPLTTDGSVTTINGTFDWVYEEELNMRDGFRWSPDGARIAFWQLDAKGVRDFLLINDTDSLYSFVKPVQYPKAGTTNSAARVGVVSASGGPITWMQVPGDPRNNYLARMDWAANSTELTIEQLNRRQTVNTVWFANAQSGAVRSVFVDRDSAWIDIYDDHVDWGPGPSLHWTPDGAAFVYLSERDGWRHAWLVSRDGNARLITKGAYDVMKVSYIDMKGGWLYFYGSPENATQMFLWRIRLDGSGQPERVTPAGARGNHDYDISPNARFAIHTYSTWSSPPVTDLVALPTHQVVRTLVTNDRLARTLAALRKGDVEFFQTDVGDGVKLDSWLMKPPDFDPSKKYPVLFYVYGEPWDQTVRDQYMYSRYLWHLMLTQQGYIVASVDNRGTPGPRGRDWRKIVNNHMGSIRVHDQSTAVRTIASQRPYIDTSRVGVWGWSGGGSSTLLLMFRAADTYKMGMSVAPVADVHNYDTIYQERYVGLPQTDSAAYRDASAVNFVSGLKGDLLVVHGSGDDNVHYQGTEQLINALVAAGKQFQMMEYPNRTHGIFEGPGTSAHLFNLLTKYLHEHLPAGAKGIGAQ
ncbi:MAG TPA: DPP IV N-terminal domain-containing protein [Gemmatimonadaceae bacterium]|nr:DPP IV N-terminal domain-containing protein [Gemmatimonadaceae bacterium]